MRTAPLLLVLSGMATAACGSLSVDVAVLDPGVLHEAEEIEDVREESTLLRRELPWILGLNQGHVNAVVDGIAQKHWNFYIRVGDVLTAHGDLRAPQRLQDDFNEQVLPEYDEAKKKLHRLQSSISQLEVAWRAAEGEPRERLERDLVRDLRRWGAVVRELSERSRRDMADQREHLAVETAGGEEDAELVSRQLLATAEVERLTLLSTATLDADPLVAAVAGADPEAWHRQFHKVLGHGRMGDFNVAVKMEKGPSRNTFPEFTLEGLTFDPSDVARMASRVTSQALALGAAMAGVALTAPGGQGAPPAGAALAKVDTKVAAQQAQVRSAEAASRVHEAALQSLAVATLQSWDDLGSADGATRKAAITAVQAAFAAVTPNLVGAAAAPETGAEEQQEQQEQQGEDAKSTEEAPAAAESEDGESDQPEEDEELFEP